MGVAAMNCVSELVNNVLRCRLVGIAHTKVDDIFPAGTGRGLQLADDIKNIRR